MPLEVPERTVVRHDLEAVAQRLEAAAGAVPPVLPLAHELADERCALVVGERIDSLPCLELVDRCGLEEERGGELGFGAVRTHEPHGRRAARRRLGETEPVSRAGGGIAPLLEELDPAAAAIGTRDADDEARDDLLQLFEEHLP